MNDSKIYLFLIISNVILIAIDFYFLYKWEKRVKKNNWNKLLSRIPWGIFLLMIVILGLIAYQRINPEFNRDINRMTLFITLSLWYIPKVVTVPFILINDIIKFIKSKLIKKEINQTPTNQGRREFAGSASWALAGVPFIITGNGVLKTAYDFKVHSLEVPIKNLPAAYDGFKIVQLSDVHAGSFYSAKPVEKAVEICNSLKPQMTVVTGDFVNHDPNEYDHIIKSMNNLNAEFDVLGCLGNHDHYMNQFDHTKLLKKIEMSGIKLLNNENTTLKLDNEIIQFAGVDNIGFSQNYGDINKSLLGLEEDAPIIFLCHDPTNWEKNVVGKTKIDLMLAGHTHGGQFGYEIAGRELYPIKLVYKHWAGHYFNADQHLYINRGLGMSGPPIRIGVNPEITEITLKKKIDLV